MLKEIILINSAKFEVAKVRLDKDLFFLGTNGSGKTSFIRAIHFLYSGDIKSLDIPRDKENFKEYYFKYDNSYIIYLFDDFFIFMYKTTNDIVKVFSKQKFNFERIVKNNNLLDLKEIKSYLKEATLYKSVRGVDEYSNILYGIDKKYLDFKIATIKDKNIFLKLFNNIFNIDKAIIDSKSIKKAIFSSLNLSDDSKFFEPEEYIFKMNDYISKYRFFKSMEQNSKNIEKIKKLKSEILLLEDKLILLSQKINYRTNLEKDLYDEKLSNQEKLLQENEKLKSTIEQKRKIIEKFKDRIDIKLNKLKVELQEIKELKLKFNKNIVTENQEFLLKENEIKEEFTQTQENIIKLKSGFEESIQSIQREIKEIEYTISSVLVREKEDFIAFKIKSLDFDTKKEKLSYETEKAIQKLSTQISNNELAIEKLQLQKEDFENSYQQNKKELSLNLENLQQDKYNLINKFNQAISKEDKNILNLKHQIEALEYKETSIKREFENKKVLVKENYDIEINSINKDISNLENLLNTPKGSFKEFLEENITNWEEEVYPIIDENLLYKSIDILKPKITSNQIFGIDIDKSDLKQILSKSEIESKITFLNTKKENITNSFDESIKKLDFQLSQTLEKNNLEIKELNNKINYINQNKTQIELQFQTNIQNIDKQVNSLNDKIEELNTKKQTFFTTIKNEIKQIKTNIQNSLQQINIQKNSLKSKFQKLDAQKNTQIQKIKAEATKIYQEKIEVYQQKIDELNNQKYTISNDKRLKNLEEKLQFLEQQLQKITKAKYFLEEYELKKEKIDNELYCKNSFDKLNLFKKQFLDRLKSKIETMKLNLEKNKNNLERLKKEISIILEGLQKEIKLFSDKQIKSDEFLLDLKKQLEKTYQTHINSILNLKNLLERVNKIQGIGRYDIYFDINLIDEFLKEITPILINIENLIELNDIKLNTLKESESSGFSNFINSDIRQKLELFSNAEDEFLSLVLKINKELKKVNFGVIQDIRLNSNISNKQTIAKMLNNIKDEMANIGSLYSKDSLFFEQKNSLSSLEKLLDLFSQIKKELKSDKISLSDTIDLSLEFIENGIKKTNITQIKNESSTGGSMLLKIALAISILKVYIKDAKDVFYLIVDEVSRLHSDNQRKLKSFANESGFKIIFVTPEPVFANSKELIYYKFRKIDNKFEVIELNR